MELEKQQYLQTFLHIVKSARSKNQFLKNVQDFDNKFTQAYQNNNYQKKASYQSFQSVQHIEPPQKPKNPFINQNEDNTRRNYSPTRSNNFIPQQQAFYNHASNLLVNNQNKMNIQPSRSQQQFYKPPQPSKTFHAGFGPKDYQKVNYNQQFNQYPQPVKGPQFMWQTSAQNLNQPAQYNNPQNFFEQQMRQNYNQMRKNFAKFNINDDPKYQNYNDLSVHSQQNFNPQGSAIDVPSNEFLAAFSREDDGMGKYYRGPIPYPPKQQETPNQRSFMMDKRMNPFSNQ